MNSFLSLPESQKRAVIEQSAIKMGVPVQAVEKDMWVTTVLQMVFLLPFADKLVFKGGTSLSKVWRVINRFSDIACSIIRKRSGKASSKPRQRFRIKCHFLIRGLEKQKKKLDHWKSVAELYFFVVTQFIGQQ